MKKTINILIITMLLVFSGGASFAMEIIAGAKVWYANWMPWLRDAGQTAEDRYFGFQNVETGGGWMYGVSASMRFTENLSLSVSYLYGMLDSSYEHEDRAMLSDGDTEFYQTGTAEITRQDLDTALNYSVTSWLKIFIGYKYQPIEIDTEQVGAEHNYTTARNYFTKMIQAVEVENHCPALGFGVSYPLTDMFVLNASVSLLYLIGSMDYTLKILSYENADISSPPLGGGDILGEMDLTGWGFSIDPSVVVVLKENIILVVGFRYQMIAVDGDYRTIGTSEEISYTDMRDHVYGAYLSAMYRFM
jgi:long-subunit fatty acid transport protein